MQAGVLNPGNFGEVLRAIASKRRQGTLDLTIGENKESIVFNGGKIVEVISAENSAIVELAQRLQQAGALVDSAALALVRGYGELFRAVTFHEELSGERLRQIVRHRVLARLFALSSTSGAYFNFRTELADYDREYAPAISVGQLLLDVAACVDTEKRFAAVFEKGCILNAVPAGDEPLSDEERTMLRACLEPGSVESVLARSLLCDFYAREALLALHERGLIELTSGAAVSASTTMVAPLTDMIVEEIVTQASNQPISSGVAAISAEGGLALSIERKTSVSVESWVLWGFAALTLLIVPFFLWRDLFRFF